MRFPLTSLFHGRTQALIEAPTDVTVALIKACLQFFVNNYRVAEASVQDQLQSMKRISLRTKYKNKVTHRYKRPQTDPWRMEVARKRPSTNFSY